MTLLKQVESMTTINVEVAKMVIKMILETTCLDSVQKEALMTTLSRKIDLGEFAHADVMPEAMSAAAGSIHPNIMQNHIHNHKLLTAPMWANMGLKMVTRG